MAKAVPDKTKPVDMPNSERISVSTELSSPASGMSSPMANTVPGTA